MEQALVITTEWKGVFFGYGELPTNDSRKISLRDCRMCVSWDSSVKGMPGLVSGQKLSGCRISPPAPKVLLYGVTGIFELSEKAEKEWLKQPWS